MSDSNTKVEVIELPRKVLILVYIVCAAWYLYWRAGTLNHAAPFFSWLIYGAEIFGVMTASLHIFMCWRLTVRESQPVPLGLTVDVFVPTYNESVELIRRTLIAVIRMDYPHTTWLLDDGNRAEMKLLAEELGCRYLARTKNTHAKAGNLNNALANSSGDFIAIFDADHAPRKDFLLRLLGYFGDPKLAFVQAPQDYFNLDSYQHRRKDKIFWTEQSLFFRVIQRGKDYWNAAFFCGSCAVIRRQALNDIGGFATGTITEDLHTSIKLHSRGWRSIYYAEPIAFGIAPENIKPFLSQRIRWGQGAMHVWRKEGVLTNRGLSLVQRLNYFASMATYFDGWQKAIFYFAPVIVLALGVMPIVCGTAEFIFHFIPFYVLTFWVFEEVGRGYGRSVFIEQYNMARFAAFAWSTLALFMRPLRFKVTPKGQASTQWRIFSAPQLVVLLLNILAMPVGLLIFAQLHRLPVQGLVANMIWAGVNAWLALAVLRFNSTTSGYKRSTYRFPVPLPATLHFQGGKSSTGIIDDISTSGFRFYGNFPKLSVSENIHGTIRLPDGPLEFSATVQSLVHTAPGGENDYVKAIGCKFVLAQAAEDRISALLYGSDLQWQVNNFRDQISTPLSWMFPSKFHQAYPHLQLISHWSACRIEGDSPDLCLLGQSASASGGNSQMVMLFNYRGERLRVPLHVYSRRTDRSFQAELEFVESYGSTVDPIYLYRAVMETEEKTLLCVDTSSATA